MFIEIADLKDEPLRIRHVYPAGEIPFAHEDAVLYEPVTVDFILNHDDRDLRIEGQVETSIRFKCSRCVKEFSNHLSTSFELYYLPQPAWSKEGKEEIELKYEEMEVAYYDGVLFDVNLMVLEQIELAMPMRFICKEDCRGLCYVCGVDLNEGACGCRRETTDSRLAALLDFRKKMDK